MSGLLTMRTLAAVCTLTLGLAARPVHAQPGGDAEALNDEGKRLFKEQRYLEAYKRFKEATSISPQGKYYFNLCFSLNYLERFQEAIDACEQVEPNGADAPLLEKTRAVLQALRAKLPPSDATGGDPNGGDPNGGDPNGGDPNGGDPNGGDPNGGDPNTSNDPALNTNASTGPAQVIGVDPFAAQPKPTGAYAWALGASLAPFVNLGLGHGSVQDRFYAGGGMSLNLFANFMYKEAQQIGLQGYFSASNLGPKAQDVDAPVNILDFGGAAYKHITLTKDIKLTPLFGVHVSLLQPESSIDEALLALGLRGQVALDWGFGKAKEHVFSFSPTLNIYSRSSDGNALVASDYGLDRPGATVQFWLGYQYRFTTPFGSGPLFDLE